MAKILITGGAGYIGGFTTRSLVSQGHDVTVVDDLSSGKLPALPTNTPLVKADVSDNAAMREVLGSGSFDAVIHFAASIEAGESMVNPRRFYQNNVVAGLSLLDAILDTSPEGKLTPIVFSSTAAVYGMPKVVPIPEDAEKAPVNVYGETKLAVENILRAYGNAYGLRSIALRYFNACGADPSGNYGESHDPETHLIPNALKAAVEGRPMNLFGTDYDTPDGTCIRDYVHVADLASAHSLAVEALINGAQSNSYNIGLGSGFSVTQILDVVDKVTGKQVERNTQSRRAGDPAVLVADSSRLKAELGWQPQFTDVESIVATAWRWHSENPQGYNS